ncbi:atlastin-like [Cimex lectularius]|uniref:GB1/RHD3-type G domain-containing protein n=1 Tax=Cimex lectularius TaxID=79782 RepID=A0A8I6THE9_CIMLE|nr:atlastin-like [Cimex lectularius]
MERTGSAIQVVEATGNHSFVLNDQELEKILLREDVKDRTAVVLSVAGVFRKGKSFLLDFFLRYLRSKYGSNESTRDWIGRDNAPLDGFSWRGGAERETTGIQIWSEIFKTTVLGEEVAIILLDTQGTFDSQSTVKDCATIFALSTMLSSIQIYNISQNIQEDDLQHLQLFTEYGKLALAKSYDTPFQKLQFLVRDWSFPYETPFGDVGGKKLLDKRLEIHESQHPELQSIRKHIRGCFSEIACFLMPHPGLKVATNPSFDGKLKDIEPEFIQYLVRFIHTILTPEKLTVKKIDGEKVKVKDLLQYFKSYIEIYRGNELPEPKSMLVATAEANNLAAMASAKDTYQMKMEEACGSGKPFMSAQIMEQCHLRIKEAALQQFSSKRKMGGEEFSEHYRTQLDKGIEEMFTRFKLLNENKNLFKSARTPAVLFSVGIFFYILSGFFALLGIYTLANFCNLFMIGSIITLLTWAYVRHSGERLEIGAMIDEIANVIWKNVMKPCCDSLLQKSVQRATESTVSLIESSEENLTSQSDKLKIS